jgi:LmbE family N-acetylglucosaminyl deacetylase
MDILFAVAHPDDETVFAGGTMALLAEVGYRVHCLCATRGEGGEPGEPPLCRQGELGAVRAAELRCAVEALGVSSLSFLDFVDPEVDGEGQGRAFEADLEVLSRRLAQAVREHAIAALITHGTNGEYGHPGHRLMNLGARKALGRLRLGETVLYTFSANFPGHPRPRHANRDDPANLVIDIGPWFPAKLAAARCHRTQAALFVRRSSQEAGRAMKLEEVLTRRESFRRAWPAAEGQSDDPLSQGLRLAGLHPGAEGWQRSG